MKYIEKESRAQITLLPDSIEDYIGEDNPVRVIDAFINTLDMAGFGFEKAEPKETGRPPYDPRDLLKLYVYGYFNKIRSSRKLMVECTRNVELFYLLGKLVPDFRTIANFRRDNKQALKQVFRAFVTLCVKLGLYQRELVAVDGTKIRAQNSKDNCYNEEILVKKLAHIDESLNTYLSAMDEADETEESNTMTAAQVKEAVAQLTERRGLYDTYLSELRESGETQLLTTDPDARRMHSKDGFHGSYNVQTAVDAGSHLIAAYEVTNHNTDQGLLCQMAEQTKEILETPTIEVVADKGYESRADILNCLMSGTVPQVALKYDRDERIYTIEYIEADITQEDKNATTPDAIQKCLHAGALPTCYENTGISVELQERSAVSCFTRNADGTVTCPMGQTLAAVKTKGQNTIYACQDACRQCKNRCTSSSGHKTVSFGPGTDCVPVKMYGDAKKLQPIPANARISPNNHTLDRTDYAAHKQVVIRIREDKAKLKTRMCTVEHPFGTVKWHHGAYYFLCRGMEKVSAETAVTHKTV